MMLQMLSRTRGSGSLTLFGGFQRQRYGCPYGTRDGLLLIQEPESSNDQFAVQLEELKQLDVDVLIDYCPPGDQRVISEGKRWKFSLNCSRP